MSNFMRFEMSKDQSSVYETISGEAGKILDRAKTITIKAGYIGSCFQCQNAFIFRSKRDNDPTILCSESPSAFMVKPLDIVECNRFSKIGELDIWDMVKTSEIVDLSKPTIKAGFVKEKQDEI